VYTVDVEAGGKEAKVVSALQVFKTSLDGGATELFAVGHFHDVVKLNGGSPKLGARTVRLDTRLLGFGYHVPF
jgi:methanesulfonate monooxygenase small subunit